MTYGAFKLGRHEAAYVSPPGRIDKVELFGAGDGGYHEVDALECKLEVIEAGVVDYGYLAVVVGLKFWVCLLTS